MGEVHDLWHEECSKPFSIAAGRCSDRCPTCQYPLSTDLRGYHFCRNCLAAAAEVLRNVNSLESVCQ